MAPPQHHGDISTAPPGHPSRVIPAPDATAPVGGLSAESIARLQQLGDLLKQGILTDEEAAGGRRESSRARYRLTRWCQNALTAAA